MGKVDKDYLRMICRYSGSADRLWNALTLSQLPGKHPWLDVDAQGNVSLHDWLDYNSGLVASRKNGHAGGRKSKNPQDNPQVSDPKKPANPQPPQQGPDGVDGWDIDGVDGQNHPPLAYVLTHFQKTDPPYAETEIRKTFNSFQAMQVDGKWQWGNRPVGDWRAAMMARMTPVEKNGGGESAKQTTYKRDMKIKELAEQIMGFEDTQPELAKQLQRDLDALEREREAAR